MEKVSETYHGGTKTTHGIFVLVGLKIIQGGSYTTHEASPSDHHIMLLWIDI